MSAEQAVCEGLAKPTRRTSTTGRNARPPPRHARRPHPRSRTTPCVRACVCAMAAVCEQVWDVAVVQARGTPYDSDVNVAPIACRAASNADTAAGVLALENSRLCASARVRSDLSPGRRGWQGHGMERSGQGKGMGRGRGEDIGQGRRGGRACGMGRRGVRGSQRTRGA